MSFHEQIFLKFTEKIKPNMTNEGIHEELYETTLMDDFIKHYNDAETEEEQLQYTRIMEILSSLYEYANSLERINRLTDSFFRFHSEKNKINIQDETLDI